MSESCMVCPRCGKLTDRLHEELCVACLVGEVRAARDLIMCLRAHSNKPASSARIRGWLSAYDAATTAPKEAQS